MKPGYIYVLVHPSDPTLVKVGRTTQKLERRISQHNTDYAKVAGQIVKETGQKWELKEYIEVLDPVHAEAVFWGATGLADIPYRGGVEVERMEWKTVQAGLNAARNAGMRPPPKPIADHVYVYTAWMRKRLTGRDITLAGHVRSKYGRSDFQCINGHAWRTVPANVAAGEGCPQCSVGERDAEEIEQAAGSGFLCLMIHPEKPGLIKVELTLESLDRFYEGNDRDGWEVHRYREVQEPALAESLIWGLLGHPRPNNREPIDMELGTAEQAFRDLIPDLYREIAVMERRKEHLRPASSL